ncbi:MAG: hypothetical protein H7X97_05495 [Opitutaceae bacterium]|nr:hypothetical protein [Verrucomicrobiales bacterium]
MIDNAKEISEMVRKVEDLELYRKIVDLQAEVVQLSTRNFELERQCAALWEDVSRKRSLPIAPVGHHGKALRFTASIARRLTDRKFHGLLVSGRLANVFRLKLSPPRDSNPAALSKPGSLISAPYATSS